MNHSEAIVNTGQITVGDLKIGAGNFVRQDYAALGGSGSGVTAGLWLFVRNHPELDRHERVYPGKTLEIAGYHILVNDVAQDGSSVTVTVTQN